MGLCACALRAPVDVNISYTGFYNFRCALAEVISKEFLNLYKSDASINDAKNICDDVGLLIFLYHSDCDGKLTPKECRLVFNSLNYLKEYIDKINYEFEHTYYYSQLETWIELTRHCYKERVCLFFG